MLNTQSKRQDQIIAILRPSVDGKSFTFIPSVYDKQNFEKFLERTHKESSILYIKEKSTELWGRLQLPPRHNSMPYTSKHTNKIRYCQAYFWTRSTNGTSRGGKRRSKKARAKKANLLKLRSIYKVLISNLYSLNVKGRLTKKAVNNMYIFLFILLIIYNLTMGGSFYAG